MKTPDDQRLKGMLFLLEASVGPEEKGQDSTIQPELAQEAVASLARAVFSQGGRLGLSGKAPFLPLVLAVAMEYWDSETTLIGRDSEKPQPLVRIMDSAVIDDLTWWQNTGILEIPAQRRGPSAVQGHQAPKAMICIGIDADVRENAMTFAKLHDRPVQIIAAPGGEVEKLVRTLNIRPYDEAFMSRLNDWRPHPDNMAMQKSLVIQPKDEEAFVPYPLLMQSLVEHLANERSQTES